MPAYATVSGPKWPGPRGGPNHNQPPRARLEPALQRHSRVRRHGGTASRWCAHSAAPAHRPDLTAGHGDQAPGRPRPARIRQRPSHRPDQAPRAARIRPHFRCFLAAFDRACVSPGSTTTRDASALSGMPNGSWSPFDHEHGGACLRAARRPATAPGARAGAAGTPAPPRPARRPPAPSGRPARAPLLRPPWTSGTRGTLRRSASMISSQAASCRPGEPGAAAPLTRYGWSTRATAPPSSAPGRAGREQIRAVHAAARPVRQHEQKGRAGAACPVRRGPARCRYRSPFRAA